MPRTSRYYKLYTHKVHIDPNDPEVPDGCSWLGIWMPDPHPRLRNRPEYAIRLVNDGLLWKDGVNWFNCSCQVRL